MDAKVILLGCITTYTILLIVVLIKLSSSPTIVAKAPVGQTAVVGDTSPVTMANSLVSNRYFMMSNKSSNATTIVETQEMLVRRENHDVTPSAMARTEPQKQTRKHYVSCKWHYLDGLGNQMFQYASVYGISRANNLTILMPEFIDMGQRIFSLTAERTKSKSQQPGFKWKKHWTGRECCKFHKDTMVMYKSPHYRDRDIEVRGYRQSWKYFKNFEDEIRKEFTFQKTIQQQANYYLEVVMKQTFGNIPRENVTLVSIHARRGDMMGKNKEEYGQIISTASYFNRAIDYFNTHLNKSENLLYIVFSDNIEWCMENLTRSDSKIIYSRNNTADVDLAVMGQCDHSVMSIGTFGWWGAWLAGGVAVYDQRWPRPGSPLAKNVNKEDYFYPGWVPL
ncbi:unnamed protein product [Owenia fusiformis]|uniref:L-Fucosyltransferase n=1 Tax=Owenia fusiformis TaxID=6347 RepID=A0A8J1TUF9_OWEFU|nr:unnamed protein product [Owenia fusiformis]